ncbi:hypothetical protein T265_02216 [Opisthorchis viverrini]|uniref:Leishmanolysin-like peptidase n=1 Tax=Opisthorchis viverrini TaxID=6198 RepID=A0A075AIG1_OPIVI|nr:hypothetical protein T265_02216 [Opisthorchis viverrini]KER31574.1 hypothetical protein T265_02216 [Opisthorchis viverrini]
MISRIPALLTVFVILNAVDAVSIRSTLKSKVRSKSRLTNIYIQVASSAAFTDGVKIRVTVGKKLNGSETKRDPLSAMVAAVKAWSETLRVKTKPTYSILFPRDCVDDDQEHTKNGIVCRKGCLEHTSCGPFTFEKQTVCNNGTQSLPSEPVDPNQAELRIIFEELDATLCTSGLIKADYCATDPLTDRGFQMSLATRLRNPDWRADRRTQPMYVTGSSLRASNFPHTPKCEQVHLFICKNSGYIGLCPDAYMKSAEKLNALILRAVGRILGFNKKAFAFLRDENGEPRTSRNLSTNLPNNGQDAFGIYTPSSSYLFYKSMSSSMVVDRVENSYLFLALPTLVEYARKYFAYPQLEGIPLEDEGTLGVMEQYFDSRFVSHDVMSSGTDTVTGITGFSLAYMYDSGWYEISDAHEFAGTWGKGKGEDFFNKSCFEYTNIQKSLIHIKWKHWTRASLPLVLSSIAYPTAVSGLELQTPDMRSERVTTTPSTHANVFTLKRRDWGAQPIERRLSNCPGCDDRLTRQPGRLKNYRRHLTALGRKSRRPPAAHTQTRTATVISKKTTIRR